MDNPTLKFNDLHPKEKSSRPQLYYLSYLIYSNQLDLAVDTIVKNSSLNQKIQSALAYYAKYTPRKEELKKLKWNDSIPITEYQCLMIDTISEKIHVDTLVVFELISIYFEKNPDLYRQMVLAEKQNEDFYSQKFWPSLTEKIRTMCKDEKLAYYSIFTVLFSEPIVLTKLVSKSFKLTGCCQNCLVLIYNAIEELPMAVEFHDELEILFALLLSILQSSNEILYGTIQKVFNVVSPPSKSGKLALLSIALCFACIKLIHRNFMKFSEEEKNNILMMCRSKIKQIGLLDLCIFLLTKDHILSSEDEIEVGLEIIEKFADKDKTLLFEIEIINNIVAQEICDVIRMLYIEVDRRHIKIGFIELLARLLRNKTVIKQWLQNEMATNKFIKNCLTLPFGEPEAYNLLVSLILSDHKAIYGMLFQELKLNTYVSKGKLSILENDQIILLEDLPEYDLQANCKGRIIGNGMDDESVLVEWDGKMIILVRYILDFLSSLTGDRLDQCYIHLFLKLIRALIETDPLMQKEGMWRYKEGEMNATELYNKLSNNIIKFCLFDENMGPTAIHIATELFNLLTTLIVYRKDPSAVVHMINTINFPSIQNLVIRIVSDQYSMAAKAMIKFAIKLTKISPDSALENNENDNIIRLLWEKLKIIWNEGYEDSIQTAHKSANKLSYVISRLRYIKAILSFIPKNPHRYLIKINNFEYNESILSTLFSDFTFDRIFKYLSVAIKPTMSAMTAELKHIDIANFNQNEIHEHAKVLSYSLTLFKALLQRAYAVYKRRSEIDKTSIILTFIDSFSSNAFASISAFENEHKLTANFIQGLSYIAKLGISLEEKYKTALNFPKLKISKLSIDCITLYTLILNVTNKKDILHYLNTDHILPQTNYFYLLLIETINFTFSNPLYDPNVTASIIDYIRCALNTQRSIFEGIFKRGRKDLFVRLNEMAASSIQNSIVIGKLILLYADLLSNGSKTSMIYTQQVVEFLDLIYPTLSIFCINIESKTKSEFSNIIFSRMVLSAYIKILKFGYNGCDSSSSFNKIYAYIGNLLDGNKLSLIKYILEKGYNFQELSMHLQNSENSNQSLIDIWDSNRNAADSEGIMNLGCMKTFGKNYIFDICSFLGNNLINKNYAMRFNMHMSLHDVNTTLLQEFSDLISNLMLVEIPQQRANYFMGHFIPKCNNLFNCIINDLALKCTGEYKFWLPNIKAKLSILHELITLFLMYDTQDIKDFQGMYSSHNNFNNSILQKILNSGVQFYEELMEPLIIANIRMYQLFEKNKQTIKTQPPISFSSFIPVFEKYSNSPLQYMQLFSGLLLLSEKVNGISTYSYWTQNNNFLLRKLLSMNLENQLPFVYKKIIYLSSKLSSVLIEKHNILNWVINSSIKDRSCEYYQLNSRNQAIFLRSLLFYLSFSVIISDNKGIIKPIDAIHLEEVNRDIISKILVSDDKPVALSLAYLEEVQCILSFAISFCKVLSKADNASYEPKYIEYIPVICNFISKLLSIDVNQKILPQSTFEGELNKDITKYSANTTNKKGESKSLYYILIESCYSNIIFLIATLLNLQLFNASQRLNGLLQLTKNYSEWLKDGLKAVIEMLQYESNTIERWTVNYKEINEKISVLKLILERSKESTLFPMLYTSITMSPLQKHVESFDKLSQCYKLLKKLNNEPRIGYQESSATLLSYDDDIIYLTNKKQEALKLIEKSPDNAIRNAKYTPTTQ